MTTEPHEGPVFTAPWQAQVFAMAEVLSQRGVFEWPTFAAAYTPLLARHPNPEDPEVFYACWADALQEVLGRAGLVAPATIDELTQQWHQAAARTPHGQPITL